MIKNAFLKISLSAALLLAACYYGPPLPGVNLRGMLPDYSANFSFADHFAEDLARATGLAIIDSNQAGKEDEPLSIRFVILRSLDDPRASVTVTVYPREKTLCVVIGANVPPARALEIVARSQEIYSHYVPLGKLEPFDRNRGLLGP